MPIAIKYKGNPESVKLLIDNNPVPYHVLEDAIIVDQYIDYGLHQLIIESDRKIQVEDLFVDGVSVSQTLYLAHDHLGVFKTKVEPTLVIPFGNPISWWIAECSRHIPNGLYGKNINEKIKLYWPESVIINNGYPQIIKDFFKSNLGFHSIPVDDLHKPFHNIDVPYLPVDIEYNEQELYKEFMQNIDQFDEQRETPAKGNIQNEGYVVNFIVFDDDGKEVRNDFNQDKFPELYKLLQTVVDLDVIKIRHLFVGAVPPGGYVKLHKDDMYAWAPGYENTRGCQQLTLPVNWAEGNYFKFHNVGLLPNRPLLIAPAEYTHSVVNQSKEYRFTIGFYAKITNEEKLKGLVSGSTD